MFCFELNVSTRTVTRKLLGRPLRPHRPVLRVTRGNGRAGGRQLVRRNIVRSPRTSRAAKSVRTPVRKAKRRRRRSPSAAIVKGRSSNDTDGRSSGAAKAAQQILQVLS